jgi:hypothetical protein
LTDVHSLISSSALEIASFECGGRTRAIETPSSDQAQGTVVVFGTGEILEIWEASKWYEHLPPTAERKSAAISEAVEDLANARSKK